MATAHDSAALVSLESLYLEQGRIERARLAPLTERGYASDFRAFTNWCAPRGLSPLPASTEAVSLFAVDLLRRGRKTSTVRRLVSGIVHAHKAAGLAVDWIGRIEDLVLGARRLRPETLKQARPLTIDDVREISETLRGDGRPMALRNRAIILVGFASALRSASLVDLELADVTFEPRGAVVRIRREKNDQYGRGRIVAVPHGKHPATCAVSCLRDWLAVRGGHAGALFTHVRGKGAGVRRLRPDAINDIVQAAMRRIGRYVTGAHSSHSMRCGLVTEAGEKGVSAMIIKRQTGHRSAAMVERYFRRRDAFTANVCEFLDL